MLIYDQIVTYFLQKCDTLIGNVVFNLVISTPTPTDLTLTRQLSGNKRDNPVLTVYYPEAYISHHFMGCICPDSLERVKEHSGICMLMK